MVSMENNLDTKLIVHGFDLSPHLLGNQLLKLHSIELELTQYYT